MDNVMTRLYTLLLTFHGVFLAKMLTLFSKSRALQLPYTALTLPLKIFCIWRAIFLKFEKGKKKFKKNQGLPFITVFFMICRQKFVH